MKHIEFAFKKSGNSIMQNSTPVKMLIACVFSCVFGVILMGLLSNYLLMAVFLSILLCVSITTPLHLKGKISIEAACLAPMLIMCFIYTPLSWFSFDGLLGCTPYLSILFISMIALTYYSKIQVLILSLYAALMSGLVIHWLITQLKESDMGQSMNILAAYLLTALLIVFIIEGVKRKNHEINNQSRELSMRDDLTGLLNRRAFQKMLDGIEMKETSEYAMVMLDIDHFKSINDLYGHNIGDLVLKNLAECIQKSIRTNDDSFRYGGDEFLLVLPDVDRKAVCEICTRIETALHEVHGYAFSITVSMGYALRSESSTTMDVLELADQRMYDAKRSQSHTESANSTVL